MGERRGFDFVDAFKRLQKELESAETPEQLRAIGERARAAGIRVEEERDADVERRLFRYAIAGFVPGIIYFGAIAGLAVFGAENLPDFGPFRDLMLYGGRTVAEILGNPDAPGLANEIADKMAPTIGGIAGAVAGLFSYPLTANLPQWYLKLALIPHYGAFDNYKEAFGELAGKADKKKASRIEI